MTTDRDFDSTAYGRGYKDGKREATVEINRLRERLEIDPAHPYDGIDCRDETIRVQDAEITRLTAEVRVRQTIVEEARDERDAALAENESLRAALREIIADSFSVYAIEVARAALSGDKQ
jgi:hypothetical protein